MGTDWEAVVNPNAAERGERPFIWQYIPGTDAFGEPGFHPWQEGMKYTKKDLKKWQKVRTLLSQYDNYTFDHSRTSVKQVLGQAKDVLKNDLGGLRSTTAIASQAGTPFLNQMQRWYDWTYDGEYFDAYLERMERNTRKEVLKLVLSELILRGTCRYLRAAEYLGPTTAGIRWEAEAAYFTELRASGEMSVFANTERQFFSLANSKTVQVYGFRGVKDRALRAADPRYMFGHVGFSPGPQMPIYGFGPDGLHGLPSGDVAEALRNKVVFGGAVRDETAFWLEAMKKVEVHIFEYEVNPASFGAIEQTLATDLARCQSNYGLPSAFREGVFNCATYPRSIGVPMPPGSESGLLRDFLPAGRVVDEIPPLRLEYP